MRRLIFSIIKRYRDRLDWGSPCTKLIISPTDFYTDFIIAANSVTETFAEYINTMCSRAFVYRDSIPVELFNNDGRISTFYSYWTKITLTIRRKGLLNLYS